MHIAWNPDSLLFALGTAQGQIMSGQVVSKRYEWDNWMATMTGDNTIELENILEDKKGTLSFNERIINVSFKFNFIVATTLTKCRIYNVNKLGNFNSVDVKGSITMILQNPKCF